MSAYDNNDSSDGSYVTTAQMCETDYPVLTSRVRMDGNTAVGLLDALSPVTL